MSSFCNQKNQNRFFNQYIYHSRIESIARVKHYQFYWNRTFSVLSVVLFIGPRCRCVFGRACIPIVFIKKLDSFLCEFFHDLCSQQKMCATTQKDTRLTIDVANQTPNLYFRALTMYATSILDRFVLSVMRRTFLPEIYDILQRTRAISWEQRRKNRNK